MQLNSHVVFAKNPHEHIGKNVYLKVTQSTIEIYLNHDRMKTHARFPSGLEYRRETDIFGMPNGPVFKEMDA